MPQSACYEVTHQSRLPTANSTWVRCSVRCSGFHAAYALPLVMRASRVRRWCPLARALRFCSCTTCSETCTLACHAYPTEHVCRSMPPASAHAGKHAYQELVERGGHPSHVGHALLPLHCYAFLQHLHHCLAAGRDVLWIPFLHPYSKAARSCIRILCMYGTGIECYHACTWVDRDLLLAAPDRSLATKDLEKKPLGFIRLDAQAIDMTLVPCPVPFLLFF